MREVADKIVEECAKLGIIVHRYNSASTCSIYLRFDNGVLGSLRISDHPSKSKFKHKYEIAPTIKRRMVSFNHEGLMYVKYGLGQADLFMKDLVDERSRLLDKWLGFRYEYKVENAEKHTKRKDRQWRGKTLVQEEFFYD